MADGWEVRIRLSSADPRDPGVWDGYIVNVPGAAEACERVRQLTGAIEVEAISQIEARMLVGFRPGEVRRLTAEF